MELFLKLPARNCVRSYMACLQPPSGPYGKLETGNWAPGFQNL